MNEERTLEEILALATRLVRIPSVTVGGAVRDEAVAEAYTFIKTYLQDAGLEVYPFEDGRYPGLIAAFPGQAKAPVMISGHFDVVAPEPDDGQFTPQIEGEYFVGRGCADMKTVVATLMVWMKDRMQANGPYPPINLMIISNEEQGEGEPMGTPHILQEIATTPSWEAYQPSLFIAAERTGEQGTEIWGQIHAENRGAVRMKLVARGKRFHSSNAGGPRDLVARLAAAREKILTLADQYLTLSAEDGWFTLLRFPYLIVGDEEVYNITAERGVLGVELRPIPQDDLASFMRDVETYAEESGLKIEDRLFDPGILCDPNNPYLTALVEAVRRASGKEPVLGRKKAGTSARFSPNGQGVVWGQTGLNPHSIDEKHFIPSIIPYYRALKEFEITTAQASS